MFSLSDYMFVSAESLQSLQILRSELHPNGQAWGPDPNGTGTRESLSVYGLFHLLAFTPQGRYALRQMFLRPSMDIHLITERQQTISLFLRPENADIIKQADQLLKKIKNVKLAIYQLQRGVDSPSSGRSFDRGVWATLRGFAAHTLRLREIVVNLPDFDAVRIARTVSLSSY